MAKRRVFELAKDLGVTSKVVMEKCRAEGVDIKNHMSTISAGLEETISEWFSEAAESHTAVETAEHVDLEAARKEAKKTRRRRSAKSKAAEESATQEQTPAPQDADEKPAEAATTVAVADAPPAVETEEPAAAVESPAVEPAGQPPDASSQEQPPTAVAAEAPQADEPAPEPEQEAAPEPVVPAGPQVVPKKAVLKGPRVVRVERPEAVDTPRPRRRPAAMSRGPSMPVVTDLRKEREATESDDTRKKKGKRRSPRRRGDRTAPGAATAAPDVVKEWRDTDLAERSQRLASAGGGLRRHRANVSRAGGMAGPNIKVGRVDIDEPVTIKSLSEATGIKSSQLIKKLMELGTLATVNQGIATDMAVAIVEDFGVELVVREVKTAEDELVEAMETREAGPQTPRAPVVTFLGHVDHGKTSLLDRIRSSSVADGEAGGITQHIGSYRYDHEGKHVVFLDTPGHEAFTAMRARGANMTDVVVLVVAADDGVMPQTAEAINHAKAAKVPIVVALNKVDMPNANPQRVLGQLAEHDVTVRQWGGDVELIETSAITGQGIEELIELLSLEAEMLELTAEVDAPATGFVIEAQIESGRGVLGRLLVRNGTLRVGDVLVAGGGYGRVRQMIDSHGRSIQEAGPSTPVEVSGLDSVPEAGDRFYVAESIDMARSVAEERLGRSRHKSLSQATPVTLDNLFSKIEAGQIQDVPIILKADVQGSIEALMGSLEKLSTDEVKVNILHTGVGGVSTGDVTLAEASGAIIIGFNVVPDGPARSLAEEKKIDIRMYRVIYDIIDDIRKVMSEGLAPEIREETLGRAEVRRVFKISRLGSIAGCFMQEGRGPRSAKVRVIRDSKVIEDQRTMESLKHEKDDIREARAGTECGIKLAGYDDIKEGDILEFYQRTEVARTL